MVDTLSTLMPHSHVTLITPDLGPAQVVVILQIHGKMNLQTGIAQHQHVFKVFFSSYCVLRHIAEVMLLKYELGD